MKYLILLALCLLAGGLSMLVLIFAINDHGVQHLVDVVQSGGEQSVFYISSLIVFIISASIILTMWIIERKQFNPKYY